MSIAVIYGGTRAEGNTELLTERAIAGLETDRIYLRDYTVLPIEDLRHHPFGFQEVSDDYNTLIDRVVEHEIIVFATPIYWYGMSGLMKNFIDRWSQTLRDTGRPGFKASMGTKTAYVIAVGGDEPLIKGMPLIAQFEHIFGYFGMKYGGYLLGEGDKPGEVAADRQAWLLAEHLLGQ